MMRWLIGSSLKNRHVVVSVAALLIIFGFTQLTEMPVDALPEFSRPYVEIQTEALGLSAQEVEAMITTPMEADMLNGTPWVEEIRSRSIQGLSSIVLVFKDGTDIMRARQVVQERLTEVFALPNVSKPPTMLNPLSSTNRIMEIGLTSDTLSLIDMSVLARWTMVPRLMGLPGVANVSIWGQRKRQLQVQVDPEVLRDEGVTLMQVVRTSGNSLWASPLSFLEASTPGTGGWIDTPNQRLGVRHILPISTAEELAQVTLEGDPSKRLGDVATVVEDHQPLIGDAIVADEPALMLVIEKFPWANTVEVTEEVEEALAALQPGLAGLDMDPTLFRPATFLMSAMNNLSVALIIGSVLMVLALLAFLFNWRTTLISGVAILLSMIAAGTVLYLRGTVVNMMVVAGLILALGIVIDDAIIDVENILRRLRQRREEDDGKSIATVILDASLEIRRPIIYATMIIAMAVMPAYFLKGITGAFYQPLVTSYILAFLASLLVAMTVTVAMSFLLLARAPRDQRQSPFTNWLQNGYAAVSSRLLRNPRLAFGAVCGLALIAFAITPVLRLGSLLPDFKETDLVVRWEGSSSASHPAMSRITSLASRELRSIPGVRNVSAHVGRAVMSDRRADVGAGELRVSIDPAADYNATVDAVAAVVAGYPGLSREVLTYLEARVREELSGTGESLVVRVYGEDMEVIRAKADEVREVLAGIDGVVDPRVQYPGERPTVEIEADLERARDYGLKPGDVRRPAAILLSGMEVGNLFEEQKVFDVVVYGTPNTRHSLTSIKELLIETPSGGHVRLEDVADVRIVPSVTVINRDAAARRIDVTAAVSGRDFANVAADVEHGIQGIDFPLEYRAELLGVYAERLAARRRVLAFAIGSAVLTLLLIQAFFRSWRLATAFYVTLPIALLGGAAAAFLAAGNLFSLGSIAGFIAVGAIAVRNGLSLISRYRQLEEEGDEFGAALVQRGARERAAPILMTAITTALLFLPLALFGSIAGLEIVQPMAIVILGGLVTSTLYTLVAVPAIYMQLGAAREPDLGLLPVIIVSEEEARELVTA
jgi:CzcA family heavy metal efflux pump